MMELTAVSQQELSDWLSFSNVNDQKEVEEETTSESPSSSFLIPTPITYSLTPTHSPTPPQSSSLSSESSSLLPWNASQNDPSCESRSMQHRHQQRGGHRRRSSLDDEDAVNGGFGIDEFTMLMTMTTDDSNKTNTDSQGANLVSDAPPLSPPDCSIQSRDSVNRDSVLSQMKQIQQPLLQPLLQQQQPNNNNFYPPVVVPHQQLHGYGNCITPSTDAVVSSSSASSSSSLVSVSMLQNIRGLPFQVQERSAAPVLAAAAIGGNGNGSSLHPIQHCRSLSLPHGTTSHNNIHPQSYSSSGGINSSSHHHHHHHHPPALQRTSSMPITPSSNNLHRRRSSAISLLSAMEQTQLSQEFIGRASSSAPATTTTPSPCANVVNNVHSSRGISMMNDTTKSRGMLLTMLKSNSSGSAAAAAADNGTRVHGHLSRRANNNGCTTKQPFPSYSHHFRNIRATATGGTRRAQNHGENFTKNPIIVKQGNEFEDPEESAIQAELQRIARDQMAKMKKSRGRQNNNFCPPSR